MRSPTYGQWYASNLDYNAQSQVTLLALGNSLTTNYTYWANNFRLKTLQTGALQNLAYAYDPVGNVKYITDTVNTNQRQTFTYDHLDRLLTAATNAAGTGQYNHAYAYNPIGNITSTTSLGNYTYPASGPGSVRPHAVSTAGSNTYQYDANGNLTQRVEGGATYTQAWDAENRLISVTSNGQMTQFAYDGDGARVLQVKPNSDKTAYVGGLMEVTIPTEDVIFADGFESGNFSA